VKQKILPQVEQKMAIPPKELEKEKETNVLSYTCSSQNYYLVGVTEKRPEEYNFNNEQSIKLRKTLQFINSPLHLLVQNNGVFELLNDIPDEFYDNASIDLAAWELRVVHSCLFKVAFDLPKLFGITGCKGGTQLVVVSAATASCPQPPYDESEMLDLSKAQFEIKMGYEMMMNIFNGSVYKHSDPTNNPMFNFLRILAARIYCFFSKFLEKFPEEALPMIQMIVDDLFLLESYIKINPFEMETAIGLMYGDLASLCMAVRHNNVKQVMLDLFILEHYLFIFFFCLF
jgi:hypothetical protein